MKNVIDFLYKFDLPPFGKMDKRALISSLFTAVCNRFDIYWVSHIHYIYYCKYDTIY